MEEMIPCTVQGQEVFQRVWQRVMAGREDSQCPVNMQGDLSCDCLEALIRHEGEGFPQECCRQEPETPSEVPESGWQPAEPAEPAEPESPEGSAGGSSEPGTCGSEGPAEEPSEPENPETPVEEPSAAGCPEQPAPEPPVSECPMGLPAENGPARGNDLPQLWEEPQEATDRTARLRQQVMEALEGWQFYRHLARRTRGSDARVLNNMAGEMHRQARKLSAAYFLLTGLRYWPSELLTTPAIQSYWGALRQRHQAEQRQEMAFRIAADDWDDPDLQELYGELIEACQNRCRQLRALLEQDMT